jgi:RNA polymerase sigma-70 factor (ECF subfamily)
MGRGIDVRRACERRATLSLDVAATPPEASPSTPARPARPLGGIARQRRIVALRRCAADVGLRRELIAIARRTVRETAAAEDCVQDALIAACLHLEQLRSDDELGRWLKRIVGNTARMRVRAERRLMRGGGVAHASIDDVGIFAPAPGWESPEQRAQYDELVRGLAAAPAAESRIDRELLEASAEREVALEALAARHGRTATGWKTRLSRMRRRVRDRLAASE